MTRQPSEIPLASPLMALEKEYAEEMIAIRSGGRNLPSIRIVPLEQISSSVEGLASPIRLVPPNNGLGIAAMGTNPLVAMRNGRTIPDGQQVVVETVHHAHLSKFLVADVVPRLVGHIGPTGEGRFDPSLQTVYAKFEAANLELTVGRGATIWGPGEDGGLLLGANAPPLDMIRLSTPLPFHLPWFFRYIGKIKGTMLFADLGPNYQPSHAILAGYRLDIQPWHWITAGANHAMTMGGESMRDPSVGDAVVEFLGIKGAILPGHSQASSNHLFGVDLHVQIPHWRGLQCYALYAYDDPDKQASIQLDRGALWLAGVYLPRLTLDGAWSMRAEYARAGAGVYRHSPYVSGWSIDGLSLGLPNGGDSNSVTLSLAHAAPGRPRGKATIGFVHRSGDEYTSVFNSAGDRIDIVKTVDRPDELSTHLGLTSTIPLRRSVELTLMGGYEHVWDTNFVKGDHQNHFLAAVGFKIDLATMLRHPPSHPMSE